MKRRPAGSATPVTIWEVGAVLLKVRDDAAGPPRKELPRHCVPHDTAPTQDVLFVTATVIVEQPDLPPQDQGRQISRGAGRW
jgi:hypothetical protein